MRIVWSLILLLIGFSGSECASPRSIDSRENARVLYGLYRNELSGSSDNLAVSNKESRVTTLDQIKNLSECLTPQLQNDVWYAPIVFFKRYKNLSQIYRQCSILRIKLICREFSDILKCPLDPQTGQVLISSQGKEASTIFAIIGNGEDRDSASRSESGATFELFSGCVYELGTKSSLRVRCLRSKRVEKFPLRLVMKVDGRTSDFLYHFNHELIVYSRIASSSYGSSRIRLHPSIYSAFINPERRMLANDLLLMEFIEGPALSSIVYKLTSVQSTLKYFKDEIGGVLESRISNYTESSGNSGGLMSFEAKIGFLEDTVNDWLGSVAEKSIIFSLNLFRRLLHLLDLFHRGGVSYYPEQKADFSRGRWMHQRSFRIHCDFHQGNVLVKLSERYKDPATGVFNLSYLDMIDMSLYNDLKIIDLEDAVEIMESDFPVPIDKFIGTHPCPVYLSDAESFSSRFLNSIISIPNTLLKTYQTFQEYLEQNGTLSVIRESKLVSEWLLGSNAGEDRLNVENLEPFNIRRGINEKIRLFSDNWKDYLTLAGQDDIIKPCFFYYHLKYGIDSSSMKITSSPHSLPCSWLSNIIYSERACEYLEMSHRPKTYENEEDYQRELNDLYLNSEKVKCKIDQSEALNITRDDISNEVLEYVSFADFNETKWGEWDFLVRKLKQVKEMNRKKNMGKSLNYVGSNILINLNSKLASHQNAFLSSNKISSTILDKYSKKSSEKGTNLDFVSISKDKKNKARPDMVFGSTDYSKESNLSGTLNWMDISQLSGDYNRTAGEYKNPSNSSVYINNKISVEFEKIVIDLMGLAALQRIITFCMRFKSEIDCGDVDFNKITRDGPMAYYLVKLRKSSDNAERFSQLLNPCIFSSNSKGNRQVEIGWVCSGTLSVSTETDTLKLIVDGRLFLDTNQTFIDKTENKFVFSDVLDYFSVNDTSKYTKSFNLQAVEIIKKHRKDAILFWESETKLRNLNGILYNNFDTSNEELERYLVKKKLELVFPKMYIFHSRRNINMIESKLKFVNEDGSTANFRGDSSNLMYLPLSEKKSDLSKQIKSVIQTGILSENVFFIENPPNVRFTTVLQKVSNFPHEVHSLTWISHSTLVLGLTDSLLRSHSYQMILAFMSLDFLRGFRKNVDFDVSLNLFNDKISSIEIKNKRDTVPIICNFSLKKMTVSSFDGVDFHTKVGKIRGFKIFNTSGAKFVNLSDSITHVCPQESIDQIDLQNIFTELVMTSLDPISSLRKVVNNLSNVKFNSSIEIRRSNWFVKVVCKHIISKIEGIVREIEDDSRGLEATRFPSIPVLLKSLLYVIIRRNKILRSKPLIFKCIFFSNVDEEFREKTDEFDLNVCRMSDYIEISDYLYDEFLDIFNQQEILFQNKTSLEISQEFIEYAEKHLEIQPPVDDTPPHGGLGFLNERKNQTYNLGCRREEKVLYDHNETVAFDIKWPLMADIYKIFQQ
ncbi:hypothetical protein FG386_000695 [Cryptosporidium ryanae]|uniref:uncharacterized protein n=1 Tax=Cryptosporidium ryanae TaxID=515981 RepID=UPI00351AAE0A|nr:hypothetical protein FG386_000695 [Cryptosporidium ryanae]